MNTRIAMAVLLAGALFVGSGAPASAQTNGVTLAPNTSTDITIRAGDVLRIRIWPNEELGGEFMVEESGFVYLPLLEEVMAAGVPISQLRAELRRGYAAAMQNPVVTISPMYRVSVTGEVQRPGVYTITPTHGLYEVVAMAGGFRDTADPQRLRIVNSGGIAEFDAMRAMETGVGLDMVQLRSGDHVVVPPARPSIFTWRNALSVLQAGALILVTYERVTR